MIDNSGIDRPTCCAECMKFTRNPKNPGYGWCDKWPGVQLDDGGICTPNYGIKATNYGIKAKGN